VSTATREAPAPSSAAPACPPWCQAPHINPEAEDHIRLVDAVHRPPRLESVAVELEQAADASDPLIVVSLFNNKRKPKGMSAGLTIDQAHHVHTALGEALRLALPGMQ
jgi:hypothetical protein